MQASTTLCEETLDKTTNEWQELGVKIVQQAIKEPLRQMAYNAGESVDLIVDSVESSEEGYGYDFATEALVEVKKEGIIDPARVTRCALQNAVSVAGTLITSNYAIVES